MRPDRIAVQSLIRAVAETEILPRFQKLTASDISEKAPGDLVTVADTAAERFLTRELSVLMPGSAAIGEEGYAADPHTLCRLSEDRPVWIIDPVDGTHNFAHGIPCYAVIVSLVHNRQIIAGWIHDPVANSTLYAEQGEGAWDGEKRLTITPDKTIDRMTGSLKRSTRHAVQQRQSAGEIGLPAIVKRYRCVGREYMDLARGTLDFAAYGGVLKPWDHVAGILMYREAGGMDRLLETNNPFQVAATLSRGNILLAPSPDLWQSLNELQAT